MLPHMKGCTSYFHGQPKKNQVQFNEYMRNCLECIVADSIINILNRQFFKTICVLISCFKQIQCEHMFMHVSCMY